MKAYIKIKDLVDGKIQTGRAFINLSSDDFSKRKDGFMPQILTEGGYISKKREYFELPKDSYRNEELGIYEFSEESYWDLKAIYGKDFKTFNRGNNSIAIRNLALCKHMNDPYDVG